MMSPTFWAAAGTGVLVLGGALKGSRALGRIEAGVKGLYGRARSTEDWQDKHDQRIISERGRRR